MIAGALMCCCCLIVMIVCSAVGDFHFGDLESQYSETVHTQDWDLSLTNPKASSVVFFVVFYLFLACYGCTWGPLGWIYPAELYSQGERKPSQTKQLFFNTAQAFAPRHWASPPPAIGFSRMALYDWHRWRSARSSGKRSSSSAYFASRLRG